MILKGSSPHKSLTELFGILHQNPSITLFRHLLPWIASLQNENIYRAQFTPVICRVRSSFSLLTIHLCTIFPSSLGVNWVCWPHCQQRLFVVGGEMSLFLWLNTIERIEVNRILGRWWVIRFWECPIPLCFMTRLACQTGIERQAWAEMYAKHPINKKKKKTLDWVLVDLADGHILHSLSYPIKKELLD